MLALVTIEVAHPCWRGCHKL